jgi:hypothetical protein
MITNEFIEHVYNGVKYYEYNGVYFYREEGLFSDEKFMKLMRKGASVVKKSPICIYRGKRTGKLMCSFGSRTDCKLQKTIGKMNILYRDSEIDFDNRDVIGFIERCWDEKRNYNVICYFNDHLSDYGSEFGADDEMTLSDFFEKYCKKKTIDG